MNFQDETSDTTRKLKYCDYPGCPRAAMHDETDYCGKHSFLDDDDCVPCRTHTGIPNGEICKCCGEKVQR